MTRRRTFNYKNSRRTGNPTSARFYSDVGADGARERAGLPAQVPGEKKCLKCDKTFMSEDVKTNRLCAYCRRKNAESPVNTDGLLLYNHLSDPGELTYMGKNAPGKVKRRKGERKRPMPKTIAALARKRAEERNK